MRTSRRLRLQGFVLGSSQVQLKGRGLQGVARALLEEAFIGGRELYQCLTELTTKGLSENAAIKVQSTLLQRKEIYRSWKNSN